MPLIPYKTGVYCIRNILNNKKYIGSASKVSIEKRWGCHKAELRKGIHRNRHLQSAWNKYGESNFEFIVIKRCSVSNCIWIYNRSF